ncbi:MAG TPA: GH32 C-terminal domain-containing protein, partial [Bacteroidales bacterium]|nr:GH32 C-terminal domain-containing protein [Bacteroidales bacterium]
VSVNPGGPNGGSATQYFTGDFDGKRFVPDTRKTKWVDYGPDDYAGVTWSNTGKRKIFLGWMSNWAYANKVPTDPWRGIMTLPRELSLVNNHGEYLLKSFPVKEFRNILEPLQTIKDKILDTGKLDIVIPEEESKSFALQLDPDLSNCDSLHIRLSNQQDEKLVISVATSSHILAIDRSSSGITDFSPAFNGISNAPVPSMAGRKTNIFLVTDRCSVEVFINDGESVMTTLCFPHQPYNKISLFTSGGTAVSGEIGLYKP